MGGLQQVDSPMESHFHPATAKGGGIPSDNNDWIDVWVEHIVVERWRSKTLGRFSSTLLEALLGDQTFLLIPNIQPDRFAGSCTNA